MAKKSSNNNNKKKNNQRPIQETLTEDASLRLKFFIEDLKHDPMFRHRLFYPIIYKEIVRSNQYTDKNNNVRQSVADVIYEYYLLKMEKYSEDDTAKIFQAVLFANGPMLPEKNRLKISDASDKDSILNPSNMNTAVSRADIFLKVLKDENLFNFVFTSTVGKNLDTMREHFNEICTKGSRASTSVNMLDQKIAGTSESHINAQGNIEIIRNYFQSISRTNIEKVLHFLIYMGNPRNIVTDFSYRPMTQDIMDQYMSYGMDNETTQKMEYLNQLEQALDSQILQKDLVSQMDSYIPMLLKEYTAVCMDGAKDFCTHNPADYGKTWDKTIPYELKNTIKVKLQRSLKQILDYTRNYLTRKLLDADRKDDKLFISRVLTYYLDGLENGKSVSQLSRNELTYLNFIRSRKDDLHNLIKEIFKNDIMYIYEICNSSNSCSDQEAAFTTKWNESKTSSRADTVDIIRIKLVDLINPVGALGMVRRENNKLTRFIKNYVNAYSASVKVDLKNVDNIKDYYVAQYTKKFAKYFKASNATFAEKITSAVNSTVTNLFTKIKNMIEEETASYHKLIFEKLIRFNAEIETYYNITNILLTEINRGDYNKDIKPAVASAKILPLLQKAIEADRANLITALTHSKLSGGIHKSDANILSDSVNDTSDAVKDQIIEINKIPDPTPEPEEYLIVLDSIGSSPKAREIYAENMAVHMSETYFKYYLRPVLVNFFGYAFDNFQFAARSNDINADIISKDKLHFSKLLTPRNVGLFTIDGAVAQDIAKFTYILTSDTYAGISYNTPDSVMNYLDKVYGLKYFNVVIYGKTDAYLYLNNFGVPYLYRGARTKIPIRELENNYEYLMDPSRGLYQNIKLPRKNR